MGKSLGSGLIPRFSSGGGLPVAPGAANLSQLSSMPGLARSAVNAGAGLPPGAQMSTRALLAPGTTQATGMPLPGASGPPPGAQAPPQQQRQAALVNALRRPPSYQ